MRTLLLLGGVVLFGCSAKPACPDLDDSNDCTEDVCSARGVRHDPVKAGQACAAGTCDGKGRCVECVSDADCPGSACDVVANQCVRARCADGVRNGDETGVDCGGACAAASPCASGVACRTKVDCASGVCSGGTCSAPRCGDGVQQAGEACDDGNGVNGDGCDDAVGAACRPSGCGNGTRAGTEACDDGNAVDGDGCDSNCSVTACGNGVVTGQETCDDGNTRAGDGCSASCRVEPGFACSLAPSVCVSTCGDGAVSNGETCDDGNRVALDGCSANCATEGGFVCTGAPSTCVTACGDGFRVGTERCDDGNTVSGDGCSAGCTVEVGYQCLGTNTSTCLPICGDGVRTPTEACDDGNTTANDGCSALCVVESGYVCAGSPRSVCTGICGDGVRQQNEACDDGNTTAGDGCAVACTVEAGFRCQGAPRSVCASVCGDGLRVGAEACDDGAIVNGDGCSSTCTVEFGFACTGAPSLCAPQCGDGLKASVEGCDDGNLAAGDGCSSSCGVELGFACTGTMPTTCAGICGDGLVVLGEPCDDGDRLNGNGCSSSCQVEFGFSCTGAPSACFATCGDGLKASTERCDDGNTGGGDGCTASCTVELGWGCQGTAPSQCVARTGACGDGYLDGNEQCDDGNTRALDGCGATCRFERTEVEPNDDGTPSTGGTGLLGNDFNATAVTNANTNGAVLVSEGATAIVASLTPVGDEDVFAFTNDTALPQTVRLDTWNRAAGFGAGVACGSSIDLGLSVRNAAGTVLVSNDDRNGTSDRCSALSVDVAPGQTLYAHVVEFGDDAAVPGYGLEFRFTPIVCGDGVVVSTFEECDDGNTIDTDLCTNLCRFNTLDEVEPNGTFALADAAPVQVSGSALIRGALPTGADLDVYRVTVASPTVVRFETFTTLRDCDTTTTTTLRLFNAAGMQLATDNTSGLRSCSALVFSLPAGTFYVQVEETGTNAAIARYFLEVAFTPFAGAEVEAPGVSGGNNTTATAEPALVSLSDAWVSGDHSLTADVDVWAITVPPGKGVRAEVLEGGATTCESNGVDSRLTLFGPTGTQLVDDDDDGRGFCSLIDGTGSSPLDSAAKNTGTSPVTMYLMVRSSTLASTAGSQFVYRLQVLIR